MPKDVLLLIARPCECITFQSQKEFSDVVELRILRWRKYPESSRWCQCNHKSPWKRDGKRFRVRGRGNKRTETETETGVTYLENEGRGHKPMHSDSN